jgi:hypothetical protein
VEVVGELVVDMVVKEEKSEITRYASFTKYQSSSLHCISRAATLTWLDSHVACYDSPLMTYLWI